MNAIVDFQGTWSVEDSIANMTFQIIFTWKKFNQEKSNTNTRSRLEVNAKIGGLRKAN